MPVYEYECRKCGEVFAIRRRLDDTDDEVKCPKCGERKPRRVFSPFAGGRSGGKDACRPSGSG